MSWIETLPSGRYRAVCRDPDGARRSQSFDRKADAKTFLAAVLTDMARGEWHDPRGGAVPLREWAGKWFAARVVRATTQAGDFGRYRTHLLPAFGNVELKDLTPLRIKTFVAQMSERRKPATVHKTHALLATRPEPRRLAIASDSEDHRHETLRGSPWDSPAREGEHRRCQPAQGSPRDDASTARACATAESAARRPGHRHVQTSVPRQALRR
jgi:hypothetical protein